MSIEGVISFPGIDDPVSIKAAVRTNGFRPNKCLLVAKPQSSPPQLTGNLVFGFGGTNVTWVHALCDQRFMQISTSGQFVMWTILDGRWRHWKRFTKRAFNVRQPDGTIDPDTEATLAEIVTFLLAEMGTSGDVSVLMSSTEKPEVIIDHERVVPEIEELLDQRGFVAAYQFDDTYKIYRVGTGATLPNDTDVVSFSNNTNPPELPEILRAVMAKTLVQSKLHLTAVGLDNDGKVKRVADLSYNPKGAGDVGGWDGKDLVDFSFITNQTDQELAIQTVGRWYQVEWQANDTHDIRAGAVDYAPGEIAITDITQCLPLNDHLAETGVDFSGKSRYLPAYLEGTIYQDDDNPPKGTNSPDFSRIARREWQLDRERGIVKFAAPVRMVTDAGKFTFADLYLVCSYSVHDNETNIKDRLTRDRPLGGTGMDQVLEESLERRLICKYGSDKTTIEGIEDNKLAVEAQAEIVLDNARANYPTAIGNTILYRGIRQYTTDGVTLQVVWSVAGRGMVPFSTFVAQNCESHPLCPKASHRKLKRRVDRANRWNEGRGRRYRGARAGRDS